MKVNKIIKDHTKHYDIFGWAELKMLQEEMVKNNWGHTTVQQETSVIHVNREGILIRDDPQSFTETKVKELDADLKAIGGCVKSSGMDVNKNRYASISLPDELEIDYNVFEDKPIRIIIKDVDRHHCCGRQIFGFEYWESSWNSGGLCSKCYRR